MKIMRPLPTVCALAGLAFLMAACTPTVANRGNIVEDSRLTQIEAGVSSRTDVLRAIGSPTTMAPFDENVWYYIGQKTEKHGVFDAEIVEEKIVVVAFNDQGLVDTVEELGQGRVDIPTVRRKTPTGGHDLTFMQQLLGNVGRFNKSEPAAGAPGPSGGGNN